MPPRAKFTKEEIINAGLEILRTSDLSHVTAREIGKCLKSSARPIFTTFTNMSEVIEGTRVKAREIYDEYVQNGLKQDLAFFLLQDQGEVQQSTETPSAHLSVFSVLYDRLRASCFILLFLARIVSEKQTFWCR